jgi:hypothetical protein
MSRSKDIKERLACWETHCNAVNSGTVVAGEETAEQKSKRIKRLRNNYAAFVEYYFPHWCTDKSTGKIIPSAKFHIDAAEKIRDSKNIVAAFKWARGHAKSTNMDVFIPMWLMCQQERLINVMVLVGKSQDSACTLLSDLQAELQFNQRYRDDFGQQFSYGHWTDGSFVTVSGVAFFALGRGQSPRGLRYRNKRPDYIVIDDIDDDELCLNELRVRKLTKWVQEALFGCFGAEGGRFVMIGNLISKTSVLENIAALDTVHVTQVNVRDQNGKPAWGALWTEKRIREKETFMSFASFQKEYMNNPVHEGAVFNEICWGAVPSLNKFPLLCLYGDPSPSNSKNKQSSMKAVFLVGYCQSVYYVIDGRLDRATNAEFVNWYRDLRTTVTEGAIVYNVVENNSLQDPFFRQVLVPEFISKNVNIMPDERKKPDKFSRIEGLLEPLNRQQRLVFNDQKKDNPHFKRLEEQFLLLSPQMAAPADGADCIEGAVWWLQQKCKAISDGSISFIGKITNRFRF